MNSGEDLTTLDPHQRYEELCALAAAGQVTHAEAIELNEHVRWCAECRESVRDFTFLCVQALPAAVKYEGELPAAMTERFIARARSEGIQVSDEVKQAIVPRTERPVLANPSNPWKTAFWAAIAASVFLVGMITVLIRYAQVPSSSRVAQPQPRINPSIAPKLPAGQDANVARTPETESLRQQLRSSEDRLSVVSEELKQSRNQFETAKREKANLSEQIAQLREVNAEAAKKLSETQAQRDAEIAQLKAELERVRSEEDAGRKASLVAEAELRTLRNTVEQQKRQLDESRRLNTAEHSARDLIGARNLHVTDFPGWDENGNPQREFGRLLYAEGRRLEFYAFDLDSPGTPKAKAAFYVWGKSPGEAKGSKSHVVALGKLSFDSAKDNRWALVVNDIRLLTGLNSILVTVEPEGTPVSKPSGNILFITSLDRKANHP